MDNGKNKKLGRYEFMWGLKENGQTLSPSEFERIFKFFDRNNDGSIDYDEFLRGLRGDLNDRRRSFVQIAFKKLDRTGDGIITVEDLEKEYNVE
jgi:Ca2+-binding EF-hand superfamily protein